MLDVLRNRLSAVAVIAVASLVVMPLAADDPPTILPRKPWTTSRVVGSPDPPPPYRIERAYPNVLIRRPLLLAPAPGTDRLFIAEHEGRMFSIANRPDAAAELFFDPKTELKSLNQNPAAREFETVY